MGLFFTWPALFICYIGLCSAKRPLCFLKTINLEVSCMVGIVMLIVVVVGGGYLYSRIAKLEKEIETEKETR